MNIKGNFRVKREILTGDIFKNNLDFRLFFLILSQAMFREGVEIEGERLNIGEWKRSYRKLQIDLEYHENRAVKHYGIATIKRAVERLIAERLIRVKQTDSGTVFIVPEYEEWQGIARIEKKEAERIAEHQNENSGTKRNNKSFKEIQKDVVVVNARTHEKLNFYDKYYMAYGRQLNPTQLDILTDYIENDNFTEADILKAIETASRVSNHFNYLTGILKNWSKNGISSEPPKQEGPKEHGKKQRKYGDNFQFDW